MLDAITSTNLMSDDNCDIIVEESVMINKDIREDSILAVFSGEVDLSMVKGNLVPCGSIVDKMEIK